LARYFHILLIFNTLFYGSIYVVKLLTILINFLLVTVSGPAEALFQKEYYALLKTALRKGGILVSQGISSHARLSVFFVIVIVA